MILMLVCMVLMLVRPGIAGRVTEVSLASRGNGFENEDLCWYAIIRVSGCVSAVQEALKQARIDLIEAACCQAIINLEEKCWSLMFPFEPIYPEFLKSCSSETLVSIVAPAPK